MAFLFKSKKNQERSLASRDGPPSQPSPQARIAREEKQHRGTPTGSLNSLDNDTPSPDQFARRAGATTTASATAGPGPNTVPGAGPGTANVGPGVGVGPSSASSAPQDGQQSPQGQQTQGGPQGDLPLRSTSQQDRNAALYPWSQRRFNYTSSMPSPFPRYGAAVNSLSSKEGDIYIMGGLIKSTSVRGDLWLIEAGGNMSCYPLTTAEEGPGPRVGHSSLLVGNAFIVFGGDTKIEDEDILDETLYLLNTSTRQWSRALPSGPRPSGRYGHSLNILGSKIYIFGGQVEGYFMNDLSAFDLNQLQQSNNRWEMLIKSSDNGGPAPGEIPPARTNHTMITYQDKMYLFGGTNGVIWFNDVWCYDPASNSWSQLDCIGYIPIPREGHAAALVDDVMYVFGGRTEAGEDLGDLAAFRISSRRWYTFQNMGPSPSPRSGHSMTTVGKNIVVVGGEPSSQANMVTDLSIAYCLDTTKIRYPNDAQIQAQRARRPSQDSNSTPTSATPTNRLPSRDGSNGPPVSRAMNAINGPVNGAYRGPPPGPNGVPDPNAAQQGAGSRLPLRSASSTPSGPPPQQQPPKPTVNVASAVGRLRNTSGERSMSPRLGSHSQSPITREPLREGPESPATNGRRTPTSTTAAATVAAAAGAAGIAGVAGVAGMAARSVSKPEPPSDPPKSKPPPVSVANPATRQPRSQGSVDSTTEPALKSVIARPSSPPPPIATGTTRQLGNPLSKRNSSRTSQTVALLKELDSSRNKNAWYESELELARKAGYAPTGSLNPVLDSKAAETFDDEDKPLIEALFAMKQELAKVQGSVDKQAMLAAKQIAEAEKQRDAAIQEAVYAKARLAGFGAPPGGSVGGGSGGGDSGIFDMSRDIDSGDKAGEANRKLAQALMVQKDLQNKIELMGSELASEQRARQLADETTTAAQKRMGDLENYKQTNSSEVETLRATLHARERELRDQSVSASEAIAALQLLRIERSDFETKYNDALGSTRDQSDTLDGLRAAITASEDMQATLQQKLDAERQQREAVEVKLTKLKAEHEARTAELVAATQRLRDVEEVADKQAKEATASRQALVGGLEKLSARSVSKESKVDVEKVAVLTAQVATATALVKKYKEEADAASDKLRSAEGRIAGLEVYQEQSSREGVSIRKQLQAALKDTQTFQASNADLKHRLANQQLETNAMSVQHNTLKDLLIERGISPTSAVRARGMASPRDGSPAAGRARELEQQLAAAQSAHEESKYAFAEQAQQSESAYREKLSQLENDYSSAIHYVKGTEKMLKQMKGQLSSYKTENARLKTENDSMKEQAGGASEEVTREWDTERDTLNKKVETLQQELKVSGAQLESQLVTLRKEVDAAKSERETAVKSTTDATSQLNMSRKDLEELKKENALLEQRAQDAEQKVSILLDQVETSVGNYRRRSRQIPSMDGANIKSGTITSAAVSSAAMGSVALMGANGGGNTMGHARQDSSEAESTYGGVDGRNSAALDSLATELETLRTHWEATNKNYRLSTNFDFDSATATKKEEEVNAGLGLSESLADWRKRLDTEEQESDRDMSQDRNNNKGRS